MYLKRKVCILLHNLLLRSFETSYFYTYKIKEDIKNIISVEIKVAFNL